MAFTLMMSALSLRMWRRNGVACDELMFLPGTPLGASHGIDSPAVTPIEQPRNEGDAAAGIGVELQKQSSMRLRSRSDELIPMLNATSRAHGGDEKAPMNPIAFTKAHS